MIAGESGAERWTGGPEGLRLGSLLVSFQRFPWPPDGVLERAPPSFGALPVAAGAAGFLLPLFDDEAFWVGALVPDLAEPTPVILTARCPDGRCSIAARLSGPQAAVIPGMPRADGRFDAFGRSSLAELSVSLGTAATRIYPTEPRAYSEATGQRLEPLEPTAAYGGWRLP